MAQDNQRNDGQRGMQQNQGQGGQGQQQQGGQGGMGQQGGGGQSPGQQDQQAERRGTEDERNARDPGQQRDY